MLTSLVAMVAVDIGVQASPRMPSPPVRATEPPSATVTTAPPPPIVYAPPPPPPPPPPGAPTPPRLRGGAISDADYPAAAVRSRHEGRTRIGLAVGVNGRVTNCSVVVPSGSAPLDATSCNLAQRRFRFNPATHDGTPVPGTYVVNISWRLPEDLPAIAVEPGRLTWTNDISAAGELTCNAVADGPAFADFAGNTCPSDLGVGFELSEAIDAAGTREVVQILELSIRDEAPAAAVPGSRVREVVARLEVDEGGKVASCSAEPIHNAPAGSTQRGAGSPCDILSGGRWFRNGLAAPQTVRLRSRVFIRPLAAPQPRGR